LSTTLPEITRPAAQVDIQDLARELRALQDRVEGLEAENAAAYQFIERLSARVVRRERRGARSR